MTSAGDCRELARYEVREGKRAIVAQRVEGRAAVSDIPQDFAGRVYHADRRAADREFVQQAVAALRSSEGGCAGSPRAVTSATPACLP